VAEGPQLVGQDSTEIGFHCLYSLQIESGKGTVRGQIWAATWDELEGQEKNSVCLEWQSVFCTCIMFALTCLQHPGL